MPRHALATREVSGYGTLLAWLRGEPRVCSMVPIPSEADEDARRSVRERTELVSERVSLVNRIGAVLATVGVGDYNPLLRNRRRRLGELRTALGDPLPSNARDKIVRMLDRLELLLVQISGLERQRDAVLEDGAPDKASRMIQHLASLRGIGAQSATVLVREAFVRGFANSKRLDPTPVCPQRPSTVVALSANRGSARSATVGLGL
jgi:transposase